MYKPIVIMQITIDKMLLKFMVILLKLHGDVGNISVAMVSFVYRVGQPSDLSMLKTLTKQ